jgi:hypothetical protein
MAERNPVKIDMGLSGLFDFCLPDHNEGDSLTGNEVRKIVGEDTGEAEIPDPTSQLFAKYALNRFDEPTPADSPGRVLEKRASAVAHRVEQLGNWRLEYDASNKLIRARELE